jgi:spore maturation protein CgeB
MHETIYIDMANAQQKIDNQRDVNTKDWCIEHWRENKNKKNQTKNVKNNKSSGEDGRERERNVERNRPFCLYIYV